MHSKREATPPSRVRAAQYMRMSTDRQVYSIEAQAAAMAIFAVRHDIDIVRTYKDEGRSGVTLQGRAGLQQLLNDVQKGGADFSRVLVYDVSRWGRFQDSDESAHYEFICKQAGIRVVYCAEQFENDNNPASVIIKAIKRLMAAEYSRELSQKVLAGQCRAAAMGFKVGAYPLFGLRRQLIDKDGNPKGLLAPGERKAFQSDRVILVPGPPQETEAVRFIFQELVQRSRGPKEIAATLNGRGIAAANDACWTGRRVRNVLRNPKYAGHLLFNRYHREIGKSGPVEENPSEQWVYARNVFQPVVPPEVYEAAQPLLDRHVWRASPERVLERLRALHDKHGALTSKVLRERGGVSLPMIRKRLGSLANAYAALGFTPQRDPKFAEDAQTTKAIRLELMDEVRERLLAGGIEASVLARRTGLLSVGAEATLATVVVRRRPRVAGEWANWRVQLQTHVPSDLVLVRLVDEQMREHLGDYVFRCGRRKFILYINERRLVKIETHRLVVCEDLGERLLSLIAQERSPMGRPSLPPGL